MIEFWNVAGLRNKDTDFWEKLKERGDSTDGDIG